HLDTPLGVGQNVVWCASLQIAWDELRRWNGADLLLADNPPAAVGLAAGHFPRAWAGEEDVVAEAGLVSEGLRQRIERQMGQKFGDDHDAPLLQTLPDVPADVGAYAYLRKRLQFATPFEVVEALGFTFTRSARTTRTDDGRELTVLDEEERVVRAFGVESLQPDSPPQRRMAEQVRVLWHIEGQGGMQSYGIELLAPGEDRIIFAMLDFDVHNARAGWTLQHAVDRSLHRMRTAAMVEMRV